MTGIPLIIAFFIMIVVMIVAISKFKIHPFLSIMGVSLILALLALPLAKVPGTIGAGFSGTFSSLGIVTYITEHASFLSNVGIFFPFIIAAILKTAQGSSTVAITTTAGILGLYSAEGSLMSALGLTSPFAAALTVMAIGAGAMTVSHANDSYFWVVTNFGGMKAEDGYKTQTMCTLLMGLASIVFIWIISLFFH